MGAVAAAAPGAAPPTGAPPRATMTAAECVVWDRERSFAATVAAHDAKAFAAHVHEQAAFDAGSAEPIHGRAAVAAAWQSIVAGTTIKLRWSPGVVTMGGAGDMAISRGPAWIEDLRPEAKSRYRIGEYISTWVRDRDGQWRVLFDSGVAPMREARADEVARLVGALPARCPQRAR